MRVVRMARPAMNRGNRIQRAGFMSRRQECEHPSPRKESVGRRPARDGRLAASDGRRPIDASPQIVLRISDDVSYMHRAFNDFDQAVRSAEAFAAAGFAVAMVSATGRFLMGFRAKADRSRAESPTPPRPGTVQGI